MNNGHDAHARTTRVLEERRTLIMGIVNVTPDSFSDGGRYLASDVAISHARRLIAEGADIIDVGGESTRPPGRDYGSGSAALDAASEIARVIPVIEGLRREDPTIPISIDTMKPEVARAAVESGATIINDVSAGRFDEAIWSLAAEHDLPYILMHGHDPAYIEPIDDVHYDDVISEVHAFLSERIGRAHAAGVRQIIADVGIGFAKGLTENVTLIRKHRAFLSLGVPLLMGASRKSFIGRLLGGVPAEARVIGSLAAHAAAVLNGASILRVHDVRETVEFLKVFQPLTQES